MKEKIKDAVLSAFVADALSLGVHWVYDRSQIKEQYGCLDKMVTPEIVKYHQPKKAGDFTHYGDQMLVLLESVSECNAFDISDFSRRWRQLFDAYDGYMDHATKETLDGLKAGKSIETAGSGSEDLAGAVRMPPLFLAGSNGEEELIQAARAQTAMTHNHEDVVNASEWMARTVLQIFDGQTPSNAMVSGLEAMPDTPGKEKLHQAIESGVKSRKDDTGKTIQSLGQMCSIHAALPSAIHLVAKYEDSFRDAMVENIMAGGDSSARGVLAAFFIGAYLGRESIPEHWCSDMTAFSEITSLMKA